MTRSPLALPARVASALLAALLVATLLPLPQASAGEREASPGQDLAPESAPALDAPAVRAPQEPAGSAPEAAPGADGEALPGQQPSTLYEQAMAHEDDRIEFEPGGRVTIGFTPRASDRWPVGGKPPRPLAAGRLSGREMAAEAKGARRTELPAPAGTGTGDATPDDAPAPSASPGVPADPAPSPTASPSPTPTPAPVDAPAGDLVIDAQGAAALAPEGDSFDLAAASGLRREVFGFLPYWELTGATRKLNYDVLSTIAYFSVGADKYGNLKKKTSSGALTTGWGGWTSSSMTSVINDAHAAGTRVVLTLSVFAWTSTQASVQKAILGSSTARLNLAKQAVAAVRDRGADGVNLDFEPLASGYESQFVALLKTFRSELNKVGAGYQLTYDTTGYIGNYPLEASVGSAAADAIFIMGYDYRTAGSATAGSIDPLTGTGYDLTDTVRAYTARVSPSRVILGIPWYGRAWSTVSDAVRSKNQSGLKYGYSTAVNYETVVGLVAQHGRRWDAVEQSPYIVYKRQNCTDTYGCVTSWRQVYYDDEQSTKLRYALVNDYGLRGTGMWALGYDGSNPELYRAISDSFLVGKSLPQAGIRVLGASQSDEGFVVEWAPGEGDPVVSYDVQVSVDGGPWAGWLTATRSTSEVWLGSHGRGYAFRARGRDADGNVGTWNVTSTWSASPSLGVGGFGRVVTDGLSYRTGPGTSASKLGTLPAGTIVAVTGGPKSADGYTWYEVIQPIREWAPVSFVERGVWVAARSSTTTHVAAHRAPNSTTVSAGLRGLGFGSGDSALSSGSTPTAQRSFSPNGDGSEDTLRLRWANGVALDGLQLVVHRLDGSVAGSVSIPRTAAGSQAWDWNGRVGGSQLPDGRYLLQLKGTAGSKTYHAPSARPVTEAQVAAYSVTLDTVAPVISSAGASGALLSPNGDGVLDTVRLSASGSGATRWTVRLSDAAKATIRTETRSGSSMVFTWDGTRDGSTRVADGTYTATVSLQDEAGNLASRTFTIRVDTTGPAIVPSVSRPIFSPNGDGSGDTTGLRWTADERATGTARIYSGTTLIRSWSVSGSDAWSAAWNGRTASGTAVPDGRYTFRVSLKDAAGNGRTVYASVVVDRTAGWLRWSRAFFPQDGDPIRPTSTLTWSQKRTATTTLELYDAGGTLVRTVWSGRVLSSGSKTWTWNGRLASGAYAPQGRYVARLTVTSSLGTQVMARSVWAAGFLVTPSASTVVPGQVLTVRLRTVEPLATVPSVRFVQPGTTGVVVRATRLSDGSYRATFTVAPGSPGAGTIRVAAKDSGGRWNVTAVPITIGS